MKRIRTLLWFVVAAMLVFSLTDIGFAFQNEPDGFRGLKWGGPPREDMVCIGIMDGERSLYKVPDEKLHIGDAWFYKIVYSFFDSPERFMRVDLYFFGERNYRLLESICQGRFGEETIKEFHQHTWMSDRTIVALEYDMLDDKGSLSLGDSTIFSEYMEAKKRAEEGKKDKAAEESKADW